MLWTDKLLLRLRTLFNHGRVEQELDAELRFHFDQQVEENLAAGMSPGEVRLAARRIIGGIAKYQEECRDARRIAWITPACSPARKPRCASKPNSCAQNRRPVRRSPSRRACSSSGNSSSLRTILSLWSKIGFALLTPVTVGMIAISFLPL